MMKFRLTKTAVLLAGLSAVSCNSNSSSRSPGAPAKGTDPALTPAGSATAVGTTSEHQKVFGRAEGILDPRPPLSSLPAISVTGDLLVDMARNVLPLQLAAGSSWITDVEYCGPGESAKSARLKVVVCSGCNGQSSAFAHLLTHDVCKGASLPKLRGTVVDAIAEVNDSTVSVTVGKVSGQAPESGLPPVQLSDLSFSISGDDYGLELTLKPSSVQFEPGLINVFYRIPSSGFGVPHTEVPVISGRGDQGDPQLVGLGLPIGFITVPDATLNGLLQQAFSRTPSGVSVASRTLPGGLRIQSKLTSLSFAPDSNRKDLVVSGDVVSHIMAPGDQSVIDLPAHATAHFAQRGTSVGFASLSIEDRYTCTKGCDAAVAVHAIAQALYQKLMTEASKSATAPLIPIGRRWRVEMRYGKRSWTQQFEVVSNTITSDAEHLEIELVGAK